MADLPTCDPWTSKCLLFGSEIGSGVPVAVGTDASDRMYSGRMQSEAPRLRGGRGRLSAASPLACSRLRLAVLALATIWLSGCAAGGSDGSRPGACPPVVDYHGEFQARPAEELALLPDGSAIAHMLSDHAVMREQARICAGGG